MRFVGSLIAAFLLVPLSVDAARVVYEGLPSGRVIMAGARQAKPYLAVAGKQGLILSLEAPDAYEWRRGEVSALDYAPDGDLWVGLNGRFYRDNLRGSGMVDRTASFKPFGATGRLFVSRLGDVWLSKAAAMRRHDGLFVPSGFSTADGLTVEPRCDDPFGNVWAAMVDGEGREMGLAVRTTNKPGEWQRVTLPAEMSDGWSGLCMDDVGFLWLATESVILQLDPRRRGEIKRAFQVPAKSGITCIARSPNRHIYIGHRDGSIHELTDPEAGARAMQPIDRLPGGPIRGMMHHAVSGFWAVVGEKVYRRAELIRSWQRAWAEAPLMPAGNHDNLCARIGDKLYSAGGKTYFGWPATEWTNLDHVWSYDTRWRVWAVEAPMLEPGKAYPGIAAFDEELWLIGGYFRAGKGTRATATVEIYNPATKKFRLGPEYPAARGQGAALTVNDRIFVAGGAESNAGSKEMFSIGVGEDEWRPEPPAPGPLIQAAGCVIGDKMYIASGVRSECPGLFVYDAAKRQWSTVKHPSETPPAAPLVTAWRDEVWVMGGRGKSSGETATFGYSTESGGWTRGPDLPLPVSWGAAASVNGGILIAGGAYRVKETGGFFNSDRVFFWNRR